MRGSSSLCVHCLQPLTALARACGLARCDAAACRAKDSLLGYDQRWAQVGQRALQQVAPTLPAKAAPPVLLWLEDAGDTLVPVTEDDRAALAARWLQAWQKDITVDYEGEDTAAELPAQAAALCAYCAGRCCAYGSSQAAFIGAATLRRWLQAHPGASVEDAIADYLRRLPAEHVQGQCCYQNSSGCVLPREQRSDICNRYRCAALGQLGAATAANPDTAAVVLTRNGQRLQAAALFQQGAATPLLGVQGPDEMEQPAAVKPG